MLAWAVVEIQGSWSLVFLQSFLVGLTGAALGLMFGSLFDHEMEAVFGVVCIFVTCQVMSGVSCKCSRRNSAYLCKILLRNCIRIFINFTVCVKL